MQVLVLLPVVGVGMWQCMIQNQNEMHRLSKVKCSKCKYAAINSFSHFSLTGFFPWHFTDSCQIPWHFQVFQTSAYPGVRDNCSTVNTKTGYDDGHPASCPRVLHHVLSAVSPGFSLVLDRTGREGWQCLWEIPRTMRVNISASSGAGSPGLSQVKGH